MNAHHEEYRQLLELMELYLLQEYKPRDEISLSSENWNFFKPIQGIPSRQEQPSPHTKPFRHEQAPIPQRLAPPSQLSQNFPPPSPSIQPPPLSLEKTALQSNGTPPSSIPSSEPAKKNALFQLDPLSHPQVEPLEDIKTLFREKFPAHPLAEVPPSDEAAKVLLQKKKKKETDHEILLLSFNEPPQQTLFLQNLARALEIRCGSTHIVSAFNSEKENLWTALLNGKTLKLIIACDYALYELKQLMSYYKESPGAFRYLNNIPLLLISDLSLYLKEPKLKPSLWKAICEILKK